MHPLRLEARAGQRAGVRARDGHGIVGLLARRGAHVLLDGGPGLEAVLLEDGGRLRDAHGGRLQGEGLRLGEGLALADVGGVVVDGGGGAVVLALLGDVDVVVVLQVGAEGGAHGSLEEAGRVGRGLGAQLGEVEVRAGAVADVHGLVELALGAEPVENDAVKGDGDDFNDDLDEGADEGPVLLMGG